jgi:hypothetical protein
MAKKTISDFRSALKGGGARPNLFEVTLDFPTGAKLDTSDGDLDTFLVKSAALPASNVTPIEVPFRGRILKIAGDRTFDTWTITIINDIKFAHRDAFERWMNKINKLSDATGEVDPKEYQKEVYVKQLDRDGNSLREYKFYGVFPTNISQIDLSMETTDTIEEFTVELQVQWWEAIKGKSGNAGGNDIS